jgi:DNA excision repair protein ERCC-3
LSCLFFCFFCHVTCEIQTLGLPLLEEYDFHSDTANARLAIALKPQTTVRDYQEKALRKMFGNGRARSGTIVLPCGAGKTLVGVTAASTVRKSCVVLCTNGTAVQQWKDQFKLWTTVADADVVCFTASSKLPPRALADAAQPAVLLTTYSMLAQTKRSDRSAAVVAGIQAREWGLMLLDEVHVVPAATFRKVLSVCRAHCKLGLTATLVREDDKIGDLTWLIGPKLFEANWLDLTRAGHLARVRCQEVRCAMPREFFREYLRCTGDARKTRLLGILNPAKFRACELLLRRHEAAGDKVLVFSDDVFALQVYAQRLHIPFIYGGTKEQERSRLFGSFRHSATVNTLAVRGPPARNGDLDKQKRRTRCGAKRGFSNGGSLIPSLVLHCVYVRARWWGRCVPAR